MNDEERDRRIETLTDAIADTNRSLKESIADTSRSLKESIAETNRSLAATNRVVAETSRVVADLARREDEIRDHLETLAAVSCETHRSMQAHLDVHHADRHSGRE